MIYDDGLEKMISDGGFALSNFLNLLCTKVGLNSILYYMSLFRSLACRCASSIQVNVVFAKVGVHVAKPFGTFTSLDESFTYYAVRLS